MKLDSAASPDAIEKRSFAIIDAELSEPRPFTGALWEVARRVIHALGDTSVLSDLRLSETGLNLGLKALTEGRKIFTDTAMLAAGLVKRRMEPLGAEVIPVMGLRDIGQMARKRGITRARAGMELISSQWSGCVVAIGNAPTALLALLDAVNQGAQPPALIIGMPVGFVNAAQSKDMLLDSGLPCFTLLGRKGGSAAAAASVNALANMALEKLMLTCAQD